MPFGIIPVGTDPLINNDIVHEINGVPELLDPHLALGLENGFSKRI